MNIGPTMWTTLYLQFWKILEQNFKMSKAGDTKWVCWVKTLYLDFCYVAFGGGEAFYSRGDAFNLTIFDNIN